ncbi:unnamed protein product, partial [marine sediment metagenome]
SKKSGKEVIPKNDIKNFPLKFREPNNKVKEYIWTEIDNYI